MPKLFPEQESDYRNKIRGMTGEEMVEEFLSVTQEMDTSLRISGMSNFDSKKFFDLEDKHDIIVEIIKERFG